MSIHRLKNFFKKNRFVSFLAVALLLLAGAFFIYQKKAGSLSQQTLSIIKPDAVAADKMGAIIAKIEGAGLHVIAIKMTKMSSSDAEFFYAALKEKPFFKSLTDYMSSGPLVAMVLEGDNAVSVYRTLMGATDPQKAEANTLRKEFGTDVEHNAVHGSDSVESAKKEISFFFTEDQIYPR